MSRRRPSLPRRPGHPRAPPWRINLDPGPRPPRKSALHHGRPPRRQKDRARRQCPCATSRASVSRLSTRETRRSVCSISSPAPSSIRTERSFASTESGCERRSVARPPPGGGGRGRGRREWSGSAVLVPVRRRHPHGVGAAGRMAGDGDTLSAGDRLPIGRSVPLALHLCQLLPQHARGTAGHPPLRRSWRAKGQPLIEPARPPGLSARFGCRRGPEQTSPPRVLDE